MWHLVVNIITISALSLCCGRKCTQNATVANPKNCHSGCMIELKKNITRCHYCWIQLLYFCVDPLLHSVSDIQFCLFLVVFILSRVFSTCRVMLRWTYCLISTVSRHTMQYCRSVLTVMTVGTGWLVYLKGSSLSVITWEWLMFRLYIQPTDQTV